MHLTEDSDLSAPAAVSAGVYADCVCVSHQAGQELLNEAESC